MTCIQGGSFTATSAKEHMQEIRKVLPSAISAMDVDVARATHAVARLRQAKEAKQPPGAFAQLKSLLQPVLPSGY